MIPAPIRSAGRSAQATRYRPAPIAGVNDTVHINDRARKGHAQVIDNMICRTNGLEVRPGYTVVSDGASPVTSILTHGAEVFSRTDADWMADTVANPGGNHTMAFAPGQTPIVYSGTSWTAATITGVDPTALDCCLVHMRRFFGIAAGEVVYLQPGAIGGPASLLPVKALFRLGGAPIALGVMRGDAGDGVDDMLAVASNAGEIAVYRGPDPDNASTWGLVGVYNCPPAKSRRGLAQIGGDLAVITDKGVMSLRQIMAASRSEKTASPITDPVGRADQFTALIDSGTLAATIIQANGEQWVRDSETGGWSRFRDLDATCWAETSAGLYFGDADGRLCRLDATEDGENPIKTLLIDGATDFGVGGGKAFKRIRPHYYAAHPYVPRMEMLVDDRNIPPAWLSIVNRVKTDGPAWDWSDVTWPKQPMQWTRETSSRVGPWRGVAGRGEKAALMMAAAFSGFNTPSVFHGYDIVFERGGTYV